MMATLDPSGDADCIAFTWVPDPLRYNSPRPKCQYQALLAHILLTANRVFSTFTFFPELTKQGNIHIHGYYEVKDYVKYFTLFLPKCKQLGFIKVKWKNVNTNWHTYCAKDKKLMKEVLGSKFPVPLTDKNCRDYKHLKRKRPSVKTVLRKIEPRYNIEAYFKKK